VSKAAPAALDALTVTVPGRFMTEATQTSVTPTTGEPAPIDFTGRTVGEFQILRRLGQGGMGQVYLAEQISLKRKVALKILRADLAANPTALQRFEQEAKAVAQATHANIVQVYAFGEADGLTYMALEYVEGRNLREYLTRKGPPELLLALSIMRQVAAALQRASELGIIHRDIKPENILLTRKGEVKVTDFGLSRVLATDQQPLNLTKSGITMGTPLYMAPEQVEGKAIDPRTDIYSFGVTCYHMLAGEPPFSGSNAFEVALAHVRTEPEPLQDVRPDLPEALCAVVHKMMAKEPAERYQTCRELLRDLGKLRESLIGATATMKAEDLIPDVQPAEDVDDALPAEAMLPPTEPQRRPLVYPQRRWVVPLIVCGAIATTLVVALGAGALVAWARYAWGEKPDLNANSSGGASSPSQADAILNTHKREEVLHDAAERYLDPPNPQAGFGLCVDLGALYLEENKLDEAEKFYGRLEGMRQVAPYHTLGQVGRGIVLAKRNRAKESNALFKEVFTTAGWEPGPRGAPSRKGEQHTQILQNEQMKYWLTEAVHYNERNGIERKDMPPTLLRALDLAPRGRP
jgi:serine/threonine-protein kinase